MRIWTPYLIRGSLGPPDSVSIPNGILIGSAIFAQLTADRPYTLKRAVLPPSK